MAWVLHVNKISFLRRYVEVRVALDVAYCVAWFSRYLAPPARVGNLQILPLWPSFKHFPLENEPGNGKSTIKIADFPQGFLKKHMVTFRVRLPVGQNSPSPSLINQNPSIAGTRSLGGRLWESPDLREIIRIDFFPEILPFGLALATPGDSWKSLPVSRDSTGYSKRTTPNRSLPTARIMAVQRYGLAGPTRCLPGSFIGFQSF